MSVRMSLHTVVAWTLKTTKVTFEGFLTSMQAFFLQLQSRKIAINGSKGIHDISKLPLLRLLIMANDNTTKYNKNHR